MNSPLPFIPRYSEPPHPALQRPGTSDERIGNRISRQNPETVAEIKRILKQNIVGRDRRSAGNLAGESVPENFERLSTPMAVFCSHGATSWPAKGLSYAMA
jgi:hypothetical protein